MYLKNCTIDAKKMIGFSSKTTLANDQTAKIWQQLMPRLKEVTNLVSSDLYSLQVYDFNNFKNFSPTTEFTKHALIEVKNYNSIPEGFEKYEMPSGKYVVFLHKGTSAEFPKTAQYIYAEWLPNSEFELDDRPHFEVLGDNYKGHENPESEEEVWIPIK
jgi:AraC family transcriptional regulator